MERIKKSLTLLPSWFLTGLVLIIISWLTLASKPLGDDPPRLFEGADKIVHGIMFGGLAIMLLLDWQRTHHWKRVRLFRALGCAVFSSIFGIIIEFAQASMGMGRGFEFADIFADTIGSFIFVVLWLYFQKFWSK